jgi:hypothetical protein
MDTLYLAPTQPCMLAYVSLPWCRRHQTHAGHKAHAEQLSVEGCSHACSTHHRHVAV